MHMIWMILTRDIYQLCDPRMDNTHPLGYNLVRVYRDIEVANGTISEFSDIRALPIVKLRQFIY